MPYSEPVKYIRSVTLEPHDIRFFYLLGEISTTESQAGRGMLSALVVHRVGDMEPGTGFYELAEELGYDTSDRLKFWTDELKKVHSYWETH